MNEFKNKYFLILFGILCSCNPNPQNFHQKELGTLLWVSDSHEDSAIKKAVQHTLENSSVIIAQVPWSPNNTHYFTDIEWYRNLAVDHGKSLMINIDWQENDRSGTRGDWQFKSEAVQQQFAKEMYLIVKEYNPDYLTLGIEVNYYALTSPRNYSQFIKMYNEIKNSLKKTHPGLKIGLSFQLELLYGIHRDWSQERSLEALDAVVENIDYLGISTYPDFSTPKKGDLFYSLNYIDSISSYNVPIGISETGITQRNFDDEQRIEYVRLLFQKYREGNLRFLIWGSMIDGRSKSNWENEIGLLNYDGSRKPEFSLWKENMTKISE